MVGCAGTLIQKLNKWSVGLVTVARLEAAYRLLLAHAVQCGSYGHRVSFALECLGEASKTASKLFMPCPIFWDAS